MCIPIRIKLGLKFLFGGGKMLESQALYLVKGCIILCQGKRTSAKDDGLKRDFYWKKGT